MGRNHPRTLCLLLVALLVNGCALATPPRITEAGGAEQARKDLAAGKVKVLEGGGIAIFAPGVPAKDPRFTRLPHESVPCGCTTSHAMEWFHYATGYNAVVVSYVRGEVRR